MPTTVGRLRPTVFSKRRATHRSARIESKIPARASTTMQSDVSAMTTTQDELTGQPPRRSQSRIFKNHFDLALLAIVIIGFVYVAAQNLATSPLPDTDES